MRYWDIFLNHRWVGMTKGDSFDEAKHLAKRSLPDVFDQLSYAEWFGRKDSRNCVASGGTVPNP